MSGYRDAAASSGARRATYWREATRASFRARPSGRRTRGITQETHAINPSMVRRVRARHGLHHAAGASQLSLLDFIAVERPRWLRAADGRPATIGVYLNDAPLGGAASLREIALRDVVGARFYDITAAQQRYGGHVRTPLIAVVTRAP